MRRTHTMATEIVKDRDVTETGSRLILITLGIMAATLMQTLDSTIVNVALPTIQGNLGATQSEGAWAVTGYIISAVIVIPLTPWLQTRFGRRQYYSVAIIGFTIASILCGIASSIEQLILYRILQGLFGGGLIATGQAALRDTFPRRLLGASQAVFALGALVGPSVGPTVGGWLTDNYSWNWVFFINLVPGIFAAIVVLTMMRNPSDPKPIPVDALGLGLLALGLGSLQYILGEGQRDDWLDSPLIRLLTFTSVAGLGTFVWWELWGTKRPIVDLGAFKYRAIAAGSCLGFAIGSVLFGATVILPQYVQSVLGFTATLSGELIFIRAAFIAMLTALITLLARRNAFHESVLAQAATPDNNALQILIQHTHSATAAVTNLYGLIMQQSTVMAYADAQWALGALTFLLLPLVFVLPRRRKGAAAPVHIPAE